MTPQSPWYELREQTTGDARQVAEPVGHDLTVQQRLERSGRWEAPPPLTWSWRSPQPPRDLAFTTDAVRVVSPAVREVFDEHLGPSDTIQWLQAEIRDSADTPLPYWVPHFPDHVDILDADSTSWGPSGLPIRYVFSASKLAGHSITVYAIPAQTITLPDRSVELPSTSAALTYVISAEVAEALRAADITGARITPARVSHGSDTSR